jgi:hypothetical protein
MASSSVTFPLFNVKKDTTSDFLAKARMLAKEENVSLPKYLAGIIKHMLLGHDLSKIHFYQDGSGDTYNVDVIQKLIDEAHAESAAGLTVVCNSKEELDAFFAKLEMESDERIKNGNKVSA